MICFQLGFSTPSKWMLVTQHYKASENSCRNIFKTRQILYLHNAVAIKLSQDNTKL